MFEPFVKIFYNVLIVLTIPPDHFSLVRRPLPVINLVTVTMTCLESLKNYFPNCLSRLQEEELRFSKIIAVKFFFVFDWFSVSYDTLTLKKIQLLHLFPTFKP